jgi:hypothetical protein
MFSFLTVAVKEGGEIGFSFINIKFNIQTKEIKIA